MGKLVRLNTSATHNLNMKFLVLFAVVASASANLVTHPNGAVTPAETPEVAAAKAAHFAALGAAGHYAPYHGYYNGYYGYPGYAGYAGYPYHAGYYGGLVAHANGAVVPVDTAEVAAAKAEHFVAPVAYAGYPYAYAPFAPVAHPGLVAHPNGAVVPVEPADVVAARAEHLAAHAAA